MTKERGVKGISTKLIRPGTTCPTDLLSLESPPFDRSSSYSSLLWLSCVGMWLWIAFHSKESPNDSFPVPEHTMFNARISRRDYLRWENQPRRRKISTCFNTLIRSYGLVDDGVTCPLFVALEADQAFARAIYPDLPWNFLTRREFFPM